MSENVKRESGYYWVKFYGCWVILEYNAWSGNWYEHGCVVPYSESMLDEIGEKIERTEKK